MKKILLIAEERERSSLADILRRFGQEVIVAQDGSSGLSVISEGNDAVKELGRIVNAALAREQHSDYSDPTFYD